MIFIAVKAHDPSIMYALLPQISEANTFGIPFKSKLCSYVLKLDFDDPDPLHLLFQLHES